jgi:hypothetical protein
MGSTRPITVKLISLMVIVSLSTSSEPTPQAIPNMVRKLRSLLAAMTRKTWTSVSENVCMAFAGAIQNPPRKTARQGRAPDNHYAV